MNVSLAKAAPRARQTLERLFERQVAIAFRVVRDRIQAATIERLLRGQNFAGVLDAVALETILVPRLKRALALFRDVYEGAGYQAARQMRGRLLGKDRAFDLRVEAFGFDVLNRRGLDFMERYGAERITQITTDTRSALQRLLARMFEQGVSTYQQAQRIKREVGLTSQQAEAVENLRDRLTDEGVAPRRIDTLVNRKARELHQLRATNIARTESQFAASAGQRESWAQAADEDLFDPTTARRRWSTELGEPDCPICDPMDGQEVGFDEPFTTGDGNQVDMPPVHVNCLCTVDLLP